MATAGEIIAARKNAGISIDPRVTEVLGTTPGLTEELYTNNVLDSLGNSYPWLTQKLERADEPSIPDYSSVIGLLGIKDDENGRTALEKFVEDFPKKQTEWITKILFHHFILVRCTAYVNIHTATFTKKTYIM